MNLNCNMELLHTLRRFKYLGLLCTFLIRILCICIVQSYFVPDEYWQALEIAHRNVFGYGYVTWEWKVRIRSFFYPFWISCMYKILKIMNLDSVKLLVLVPRLAQAFLSAISDVYLWLWLKRMLMKKGKSYQQLSWTYLMWIMSLFINYCSTRTLTNTAELNFTILGLYYYPWNPNESKKSSSYLWFVGFACLVRPTAVIFWAPLCAFDILFNFNSFEYIYKYFTIVFKIIFLSILIDFAYYKRIVLTPLNFFIYNGQYNIGTHYGVHSFTWYFYAGIPILLGPIFILFYFVVFKLIKHFTLSSYNYFLSDVNSFKLFKNPDYILLSTFLWTIFFYSIVSHKEFRFILPLVPVMLYLLGANYDIFPLESIKSKRTIFVIFITFSMIIVNFVGLVYLGLWHQVGPAMVTSKLADIASKNPLDSDFLFLTPCHSTPLYSHIHVNITTRFITCEPNLKNKENYKDESDIFFENPEAFLNVEYSQKEICSMPSHIIFFSYLKPLIDKFLHTYNYTLMSTIFHAHFTQDRHSQYIDIYQINRANNCS